MTVNEKLRNTTIRHSIYMEQLKNNEVKKIIALLNKTDVDLRKQLLKRKGATPTITSKRLELMKKDVAEIIADAKQIYTNNLTKTATGVAQSELNFTNNLIKNAIPEEVPISFIQPAPSQIMGAIKATPFANTTTQTMIADWALQKKNIFTNAIQQAYVQGKNIDDVVSILFGSKKFNYTDGLVDSSRRQVRTQVRTAINHFASTSREIIYAENQDIIKGVQWVSTLDGRTTLLCMNLDGKVDYADGSKQELNGQRPPAHYGCRSTTVPVIKSLKEMGLSDKEFSKGTRASMNGQIPETETYKTWFAKQDEAFQRKTLGAGKYELYKNGGYTLDKFVDNGQTLTLKQLSMLDNPKNPAGTFAPFTEQKTVKSAEEWMRDKLGFEGVSYKGADISAVNEMNKSVYDNFSMFPELKNSMKDVGTSQGLRDIYADRITDKLYDPKSSIPRSAYVEKGKKHFGNIKSSEFASSFDHRMKNGDTLLQGVGINSKYAKNPILTKQVLEGNVLAGFHPKGCTTIKSMIDHEMGHEIDKLLGRISDTDKFKAIVSKYDVAKDLSKYPVTAKSSTTMLRETLAEGWSEYLNNPTPRPLAREIGNMIKDEYAIKFGGK